MKARYLVILAVLLTFGACQQLPTEPEPIDLSQEQPIAVADTAFTDEDAEVAIDVLANDSSPVGDDLTVSGVDGDPTQGSAEVVENKVRYVPTPNFTGIDSLSYLVSGSVLSSSAPVYIIVRPVNDPPVANNDSFLVAETIFASKFQADLDVLANDTDIDGDRLSILSVTAPTNGRVEVPEGGAMVVYVPNTNFVGADAFRYTIQDGNGGLDVADVSITVHQSNDTPVANVDSWAVREDEELIVSAPGVLENDTDEDSDQLEAVLVLDAAHGDLLLSSDGSFTYNPDRDFSGGDEFQYVATDGLTESNAAVVSITVFSVNDRPVAAEDFFQVNEDAELNVTAPGVLGNDLEPEGGSLSASLVSDVTNGVLALSPSGAFNYVGNQNFFGQDSFTYVATDGSADSDPVDVTIEVRPVNDPPAAAVDAYETNEDEVLVVTVPGVLANDVDIDLDTLAATLQTEPSNGIVSFQLDGSFTYTPTPDFSGLDGFTYAANDGVASSIAAVSLKVNPQNDVPIANGDVYETPANIELKVVAPGLLENDSDIDGDRLSAEILTEPQHGKAVLGADGSFSYVPNSSFAGEDLFTYRAGDATTQSEPAEVVITVTAVGRPPVAADDFFNASSDSLLIVEAPGILENDADNDQDILTAILVVDVAAGTLSLSENGAFTYQAPLGFTGLVTFAYRATDGLNVSNVAIVRITVQ